MAISDPSPEQCLEPGYFVDSDHPAIAAFVEQVFEGVTPVNDPGRAVALFYAVRDGIRYDPYNVSGDRDWYRASSVVKQESAYSIPKAVLLTAACRAAGIPSRLGFADVRNHLQSERLREVMGTDLFAYHGYSELWLNDRWVKVSSAFNIELCERFGTLPLEFDGINDALMHPFDALGNRHMEYVRERGSYDDLPLDEILEAFAEIYSNSMGQTDIDAESDPMFAAEQT